jgi:hypothetical protein
MNKKIVIFIGAVLIIILLYSFKSSGNKKVKSSSISSQTSSASTKTQEENNSSLVSQQTLPADKIEVVHFHATRQCFSCITVGKYALQTIKDKFLDEYQSGKIVFIDINVELPENKEIVTKYQARGSSLFVNAISDDKDNIKEDTTVWQLVNSQEKFADYFEDKLNTLLGK